MIKNKLTFSLFLAMMITVSKSEETKETEVKKEVKTEEKEVKTEVKTEVKKREEYYNLENKNKFLAAMAQAQKTYDEAQETYNKAQKKTEEEKKKALKTLNEQQEAIQKQYNLKPEDIKKTPEELNKNIEASYAGLSYTDKAMVLCNNHWGKAAFITGAVVILVGAYKYFSWVEDDANDEEEIEN